MHQNNKNIDLVNKTVHEFIISQLWQTLSVFCKIQKATEITLFLNFVKETEQKIVDTNPNVAIILKGISAVLNSRIFYENFQSTFALNMQNLFSFIAKLSNPDKTQYKIYLDLIGKLSYLIPKEYLQTVFNRNLNKIMEDYKKTQVTKESLRLVLKNFNIVLTVVHAVQFNSSVQELAFKFIREFINSESILQKKTYKFIHVFIEKIHFTYLKDLLDLML